MAFHWWKVQQHGEASGALNQRSDSGLVQADDEVALPVTRHRAVSDLRGSLADHDLRGDEVLASSLGPSSRNTERPPGSQARDELATQGTSTLDVQRLINGLV